MKIFCFISLLLVLILFSGCNGSSVTGSSTEPETIRTSLIQSDSVRIISFIEDGTDKTALLAPFVFIFEDNGRVTAVLEDTTTHGTFRVFRDDGRTELAMNFPPSGILRELTDDWYFISQYSNRLRFEDSDDLIILELN